ncbi:hypothetical protein MKX01_023159 [Papaver californicum]|nr:hypothetical protein MKX01_023159 [Papaver californicum]
MEGDGIVRVDINKIKQSSDNWGSSTMFEPRREGSNQIERRDSNNVMNGSLGRPGVRAPEQKLTLFALRLAILEKMATGLGTLGFIWATVVLLGGFAITLDTNDFWFVTVILLIEGARIFSRSHELEWQHQATWSFSDAGKFSFRALKSSSHFLIRTVKAIFKPVLTIRPQGHHDRAITKDAQIAKYTNQDGDKKSTRTWRTSDVPLIPYTGWVFLSRNISKFLYWLQLFSASACVALSMIRKGDSDKRNRKSALNIFYSLALAEAMLFLLETAYWEWTVIYHKLLENVNRECEFDPSGMVSIKRFFYDAYSKCVNGSVFDGLKMDLVSFAMELLASESSDEQLTGARILQKFVTSERFSEDTLQKIGISISVMEFFIFYTTFNRKDPLDKEIRRSAAEILSILAGKKQNSLRVAGIPGAMESISSLLNTGQSSRGAGDEICQKNIVCDRENYEFSAFNHLGLLILKKLARDHDNCGKIGNTRGLLPKIIDFTHTGQRFLRENTTKGATGKLLRQEISEIVFTISNIRDILRYGENYTILQKLGIQILTSLALEEIATERIGSTGEVLKDLFKIFFNKDISESQNSVRVAAGEALAMLAFESGSNCGRILKLTMVEKLVLQAIMLEGTKMQEVMLGLAAKIFRFMTTLESDIIFEETGIKAIELAKKLVQILEHHDYPPIKVPRIRRFTIELAIWMMKEKKEYIQIFKHPGMEKQLENVTEITSELESFNVFSGTIGRSRDSTTIHSLVETAVDLLADA